VEFDADVVMMDYFVPIGPGSGPSTFALIKKNGTMYVFGNDGGFRYTHMIEKVSVAESLRSNPNPLEPPTTSTPQPSGSSSLLSTGSITGIVVGVIVVLAGIVVLLVKRYRIRRRSKINKTTLSTGDRDQSGSAEDDNSSYSLKKLSYNGGPNSFYLEGKYPDSCDSESRTTSTDMLPMAPITPVPEHLQVQMKMLQEQMREVQERIQAATQFSNHPRPSVVRTVSYDQEPTALKISQLHSTTTATPASRAGHRRLTSSAPPAGSAEDDDMYSPSAPAYSSINAQPAL
jgi:hypothetical protein